MKANSLTAKLHPILFIIGYLFAVIVAVAVTVSLFLGPTIFPDNGKWGSIYHQLDSLFAVYTVGVVYTGISAFPGYVFSLLLAHRMGFHSWQFYMLAGIATAILAHGLFFVLLGNLFFGGNNFMVFFTSLPGGAAGGYAYFLWRRKMLSVWVN